MSLVINNNIMAYGATNALNGHYAEMGTSVERLSSGLRINGAADDAAGLAVRELMRSDISTLQQGIRNANDAVSMIQTADGALGVIDEKLIRMKELAEQAATGSYDSVQRNIINDEYQQMASEITRIANATDFNQIKLLDGSLSGAHQGNTSSSTGSIRVQFGTGNDSAEDYYDIAIEDSTSSALGVGTEARAGADQNVNIGAGATGATGADGADAQDVIDDEDLWKNFAEVDGMKEFAAELNAVLTADGALNTTALKGVLDRSANDLFQKHIAAGNDTGITEADMNKWAQDMAKMFDVEGDKALQDAFAGVNFKYSEGTPGHDANGIATPGTWAVEEDSLNAIAASATVNDPEATVPTNGDRGTLINAKMNELNATMEAGNNVSTQANAQRALAALDEAIVKKDGNRAELGAYQNRLESTVANLTVQRANLQSAESRVSDIDVASEMTNFVRNQTLTQSAVGMLSQANSLPQMALQLIG